MNKIGPILLAVLLCLTIVFGTGRYKATAQVRLQDSILADHKEIIRLQEKKKSDCKLVKDYPENLLGICF